MPRTFTTIFHIARNVHLVKDIGMVPFYMHKVAGYASLFVTYLNDTTYDYANTEARGLKLEFIPDKGRRLFAEKAVLQYIRRQARKINLLNLYHLSKFTMIYGLWYKLFNPGGFLYIKLDAYNEHLEAPGGIRYSKKRWKQALFKKIEQLFIRQVDLFSIESSRGVELFRQLYPSCSDKIVHIINGVNDLYLQEHFPRIREFREKENLLITVGRIGGYEKNNEMLLDALAKVDLKDWKVLFVGPVFDAFQPTIDNFYRTNQNLREKVVFTGEVSDRNALYEIYNKAKVNCLTSPNESFGLVFTEGMYFGNYLLGTDGMSSFDDLSGSGEWGTKVKAGNSNELARSIQFLVDNDSFLESKYGQIVKFTTENLYWSHIIGKLREEIDKRR